MTNFPVTVFAQDAVLDMSSWNIAGTRYTLDLFAPSFLKWLQDNRTTDTTPLLFFHNATVVSCSPNAWFRFDNRALELEQKEDGSAGEQDGGASSVPGVALVPLPSLRDNPTAIQHVELDFHDPLRGSTFAIHINILSIETQRRTFYDLTSQITGPFHAAKRYRVNYLTNNDKDLSAYVETDIASGHLYFPGSVHRPDAPAEDRLSLDDEVYVIPVLVNTWSEPAQSTHEDNPRYLFCGRYNHPVLLNADGAPVRSGEAHRVHYEILVDAQTIVLQDSEGLPLYFFGPFVAQAPEILHADHDGIVIRESEEKGWTLALMRHLPPQTLRIQVRLPTNIVIPFTIHLVALSPIRTERIRAGRDQLSLQFQGTDNIDETVYPYRPVIHYRDTRTARPNRILRGESTLRRTVFTVVGTHPFKAVGTLIMLPLARDRTRTTDIYPFTQSLAQTVIRESTAAGTYAFISHRPNQ